jgi:PAS domain S-box-containing protein
MSMQEDYSKEFKALKKLAEERLGVYPGSGSPDKLQRAIHELAVHRVELEMQNEELVKSRDELEKSLARYKELYDFAPLGYITLGCDGTIHDVNLAAANMLGLGRSRLSGELLRNFVWAEDISLFDGMLTALYSGKRAGISEIRFVRGNVGNGGVLLPDATDALPTQMQVTLRIDAVVGDDLQECRIAMIDISEQKSVEIENAALHASMAQVRRMESIGRLAGGVAHDFNNMLQVMLCNVEMMGVDEDAERINPERLSEMTQCIQKSASLVRQLLAFARSQPFRPEVLDLNTMVANMTKMLGRLLGENIRLTFTHTPEQLLVKMDPSQIDQILANLAVNARDAINGCGVVTIRVSGVTVEASNREANPEIPNGSYALLTVTDSGSGIDPSIIDNIFEPFFSTKPLVESTGLGLASVYGIVRQNHGFIRVLSEVGQGTTFNIYLPLVSGVAPERFLSDEPADVPEGQESILLVEDDERVRRRTAEFLEQCGYTVLQASTPEDALRLFDASFMQIDLLITDLVMPGMSGRDLAMKITSRYPGLPTLFISGYASESLDLEGAPEASVPLLSKPYSLSSLAYAVREVLDKG